MFYITGDCHGDFKRFTRHRRELLPFVLKEDDYVIVCGDFGLCWAKNKEFEYYCDCLGRLPFTILWVQGNHENYNMIAEYEIEEWNGGKVRHIVRDKIILLERGQVFDIEGTIFFTFGGASSHDISGGVLDRNSVDYDEKRRAAIKRGLPYRVLNVSWWEQELPTEAEMAEGLENLKKVDFKVDYVISHCGSNRLQNALTAKGVFEEDVLTCYFEELEDKLQYKHWICGHYHRDVQVDDKHTILYQKIVPLRKVGKCNLN